MTAIAAAPVSPGMDTGGVVVAGLEGCWVVVLVVGSVAPLVEPVVPAVVAEVPDEEVLDPEAPDVEVKPEASLSDAVC